MATKYLNADFRQYFGTNTELTTANALLLKGEIAVDVSERCLYVGNGSSRFTSLYKVQGYPVVGTILNIGYNATVPAGFLLCNGQAVSRTTYADLYAIIGTTYGAGNGSSTFNVPNVDLKVISGETSSSSIGATGGSFTHYHSYNGFASGGAFDGDVLSYGYSATSYKGSASAYTYGVVGTYAGNNSSDHGVPTSRQNHNTPAQGNVDSSISCFQYTTMRKIIKY